MDCMIHPFVGHFLNIAIQKSTIQERLETRTKVVQLLHVTSYQMFVTNGHKWEQYFFDPFWS